MYYQTAARTPAEARVAKPQERLSLPGVDFTKGQRTLLLVLRSSCPYCEKQYAVLLAHDGYQGQGLFSVAAPPIVGGHAHRFRDTFAISLLLKGVDLANVSILLGHSSIKVTEAPLLALD